MFNIIKAKSLIQQKQERDQQYDAFKRPPDFLFAQRHGEASRFAIASTDNVQLCPCCGMPIKNEQLPLCSDKQDINFNGAGIPLYFEFIQFSFVMLVVLGLISGIYNTITNIRGETCNNNSETCSLNYYNKYSLSNNAQEDIVLNILDLLSTLAIIGLTVYYRKWMNLTALEVDNAITTISDFSIQVSNLPYDATEDEIKEFFSKIEKKGVTKELQIEKICLGYNIKQYTDLINEKLRKEIQLSNLIGLEQLGKQQKNSIEKVQLEKEIAMLNQQIQNFEQTFQQKINFSGVAFITFNTSQQAQECRKYHNQNKIQLLFKSLYNCFKSSRKLKTFRGKTPYVVRAPEPGDVIWENLGEDPWKQIKNSIMTTFATLLILGICFGAILGISIGQDSLSKSDKKNKSIALIITVLGLIASFVISLLNNVMGFTIKKLVGYENPFTQTDFNISFANKLGMSQFLNSAIIPLLVNLALQNEDFLLISLWKNGGLNSDVSLILIMNAIFPWLFNFVDIFYFWKIIKRYRAKSQGAQSTMIQREANLLFEGTKADLSQKYATIVKSLMLTFFYCQLLPIGIPITLGFLIINYWVEKYLLLKRQARGPALGKQLAEEMIDLYLELTLVLFAAGNCIWQKVVVGEINGIVWAQLAIASFQFLVPIDWIFEWVVVTEEAQTNETFKEIKNKIWDDYSKRNPVTQQKSIEEWIAEQGGEQNQKVQSFLQKLQLKQQKDMEAAQHKLIKQFIPKELQNSHYQIRKNQVLPNNLEESLLIKEPQPNVKKADIRQAESILYPKRETEIVNNNPRPIIKQADSFTYD